MTVGRALVVAAVALGSAGVAWLVASARVARHGPALVRTNVEGKSVPAVLGDALSAGALAGGLALASIDAAVGLWIELGRMLVATAIVATVLWAAGRWDDLQGDERPRGFGGHLGAARSGRVTGGLVKLMAGGLAGLAAGAVLASGWTVVEIGVVVALTANLLNLLDRAPGRAGKVALLAGVPVALLGGGAWGLVAVPLLASLAACMAFDLRARAMLGDAGANPLGGVVGLGLAASLDRPARLVAIGVLLALNLLSERYSFSRAIERTPVLRTLDLLGRKSPRPDDPASK